MQPHDEGYFKMYIHEKNQTGSELVKKPVPIVKEFHTEAAAGSFYGCAFGMHILCQARLICPIWVHFSGRL